MQIDRNEKEVADAVDAATVLPDRRSACILGDTTLHFYRYQCKFYVAHWEGGNVMSEKFKSFIEQITEKTGLDAKRVETAARDYFTNVD